MCVCVMLIPLNSCVEVQPSDAPLSKTQYSLCHSRFTHCQEFIINAEVILFE